MKSFLFIFCLLSPFCLCSGNEQSPPGNLITLYGPLAKPIWKSYHKDGKLNLELFIRDHIKLGSIHDGDREEQLAWCLMQINEDPKPVFDKLLASNHPEEVGFALYTIWSLGDPRYYRKVVELCESNLKLPNWNFTTVASMAELIKKAHEREQKPEATATGGEPVSDLVKKLTSDPADWYLKAMATQIEEPVK